jgi:hypothetical protein
VAVGMEILCSVPMIVVIIVVGVNVLLSVS